MELEWRLKVFPSTSNRCLEIHHTKVHSLVIKKGKVFICSGNIVDGIYILTPDKHELYNFELDNNSHVKSLKRKFPSTGDAYL